MKRYLITGCLILSFLCLHGQGEYKASIVNAETIVKTLEDFFKLPVEPGVLSGFYDIEINIKEDEAKDVDAWIKLFNENGIVLRKDKKILELIEIAKQK